MAEYYVPYNEITVKDVETLFFPVGLHPIYFALDKDATPRDITMFLGKAPKFRGIVDEEAETMLSCVSTAYHLITNKDAYDMGLIIASEIFGDKVLQNMKATGAVSKDRGYCYMFLKFEKQLHIQQTNHYWHAFLRITNSYDKSKSLRYELGFELESLDGQTVPIGLLVPSLSMDFAINHLWKLSTIRDRLFDAAYKQYSGINVFEDFEMLIGELLDIPVVDDEILPLFCKLAKVKKLDGVNPKDVYIANKLYTVEKQSRKWISKCGNNAYAALCAYTELAASLYKDLPNLIDNSDYQSIMGMFMDELIKASRKGNFSLYDFIGKEAYEAKNSIKIIVSKQAN